MTLDARSVAVITGAGAGIGRALALRLAKEGIEGIAIADLNAEGLEETSHLLRGFGVRQFSDAFDVTDLESFGKFSRSVIEEFGRVTHLVNNAGVGLVGRTEEVSLDDMRWLFDINFWGTVYGTKLFLPVFRSQGSGHVVNLSSVLGLMAAPGQSTYCASKFAVRGFTESLRHELEGTGILVTCVHPGGVRTNIVKTARKGEYASARDKRIAPAMFDKITKTLPEQAAEDIVSGIRSGNSRILIGRDAVQISGLIRLFPKRYFAVMDRMSGGLLSRLR